MRILELDLNRQESRSCDLPEETERRWIGGRGMAGCFLRPHITKSWDDPEMPLIFMTGPLVGTRSPASGHTCIMSRSPLTGTVGDCSAGGSFGTQLRAAGYDGLVVRGKAQHPTGIELTDDHVTFVDASRLTGKDVPAVAAAVPSDASLAAIGRAAEHGVRFSSIVIDGAASGRNGLGMVCAAKNLKYISVQGNSTPHVDDPEALERARQDIVRLIAASPFLMGEHGITNFGAGALFDLIHSRRMMPTANFRKTYFAAAPTMNAVVGKRTYATERSGCSGCHILCQQRNADGLGLPAFEAMSHFSALLENDDLDTVVAANQFCNQSGMDPISAAATLACYAELQGECLHRARIMQLLEETAAGGELAVGADRYAAKHGHGEMAMTVKKQELPAYDPRGAYGMALSYATSTRGACHLCAFPISHEILRKPVATDRFSFSGKARIIKIAEDSNAVIDSLTACKFVFFACSLEEYAKVYTAVTGRPMTAQDLLAVGERIFYNERLMNAANGFGAAEDDLPARFFEEPGSSGNGIEVAPIDRKAFLLARENYYTIRGLDPNGMPTQARTQELGLE